MQLYEWLSRTMLIERAIGVITYCLVVVYVFRAFKYKTSSNVKRSLNHAIILFAIISFFCIPAKSADLTRIREMTNLWGTLPINYFFKRYFITSTTPMGFFLYYVFAKIGVSGLLPAFCSFVFYLNSFHIFKSLLDSNEYSRRSLSYAFLLFMSAGSFYEVISGVRCFMTFSIVLRFIFDEIYFNKPIFKHIIFYVIAALIHPAATVLIIVWLVYYIIFIKKKLNFHTIFNILTIFLFIVIGLRYGNVFIDEMVRKGSAFISSGDSYTYIWEYIIGVLQLFTGIYILFMRTKYMRHQNYLFNQFAGFLTVIYSLVVILCFEYNIFHRYLTAASFLQVPVLVETLTIYEKEHWKNRCYVFIQLMSYLIFLIACLRGNLSGFKYLMLI